MNLSNRRNAIAAILAVLALNLIVVSVALVWLIAHTGSASVSKKDVETIVDTHLKAHPEIIRKVFVDLLKNPQGAQQAASADSEPAEPSAEEKAKLIKADAKRIFYSPHQVVLGNPNGKLSMVLFFDYNCGFCRRAHGDMLGVMKANPDLRMVLKEYPILGPASVEAAKVAIALRMQDPNGKKYAAFHEKLMGGGQADGQVAKDAARAAGADMKRLERDLTSGEIQATLSEGLNIGTKLGVNGTPSYVVGDQLVIGAVGEQSLQTVITQEKGKL